MSLSLQVSAGLASSRQGICSGEARSASAACLSDDEVATLFAPVPKFELAAGIEEHLALCPDCREVMLAALLAVDREPDPCPRAPARCTVLEPGLIVAERFAIKRLLARGGIGEIYEAYDLVERSSIALKTVKATLCDQPLVVERLLLELRVGRRVRHANVCRHLESFCHTPKEGRDSPLHFFTMQLVAGGTLRQRVCARGPLPIEQGLAVARSILRGLSAIHAARVVHRDLKSDNIMLDASATQVTIIDFGLARRADGAKRPAAAASGGLSGSLGYMAPEQILGRRVGPEADIFSFGVVLFEALAGRLPFEGLEGGVALVARQLDARLLRLRDIVPQAPPEVEIFLARCLAKSPAERCADGRQALRELSALLGEPQRVAMV